MFNLIASFQDDVEKNCFTFQNLGPVKEAKISLNDLTIITGDNNVGKTYLSYAIYFAIMHYPKINAFNTVRNDFFDKEFMLAFKKLSYGNPVTISLEEYNRICNTILNQFYDVFKKRIADFFNVEKEKFKDFNFTFSYPLFDNLVVKNDNNEELMSCKIEGKNVLFEIHKNVKNESDIFYNALLNLFICPQHNTFIITAERLGIVLFRKELDARRSNIINQLQQLKVSNFKKFPEKLLYNLINDFTSRYSNAIHENINYVRDMFSKREKQSEYELETKVSGKLLKIMGGNLKIDSDSDEIRFYSNKKNAKFDIPLHFASTSVRSISLLFHYLRYQAQKNDILFIDEPESHLSLNNQIELIRLIVQCVNNGLKIFLTTHSEIMLKELNNLIKYNKINEHKLTDYKIKLPYDKTMAIDYRKINLYEIDKGYAKRSIVTDEGIEPKLFDNIIRNMNQISDDIDFINSLQEDN